MGLKNSGKSVLIDILLGFKTFHEGTLSIDNVPIQDYPVYRLRNVAALVRQIEFFSGTLYENLVLHRTDISVKEIHEAIHFFGLDKTFEILPDGLNTYISNSQATMSTSELKKLALIRAVLSKPELLIVDGLLDYVPQDDLKLFMEYLKNYKGMVIVTTQSETIAQHFNQVIHL